MIMIHERKLEKLRIQYFWPEALIKISIYWHLHGYKKERESKQANKSLGNWENCLWCLNSLWNRAIIPTLEILHQDNKMNVKCFEVLRRYSIKAKWHYYLDTTFVTVFKIFIRTGILSRYFSETSTMPANRLINLMGIRYWNTQIWYKSL